MSKRTIEKHIKYNSEEWDIVSKKAAALGQRAGTYVRRISVNGTIKYFDMKQFNHLIMSFNRIGNELNQIAKVANSTNSVFAKDIEDMKKSLDYLENVFANYLFQIKSLGCLRREFLFPSDPLILSSASIFWRQDFLLKARKYCLASR